MRIALFMYSFVAGGMGRVSLTLARGLAERGIEVDYVVTRNAGKRKDDVPAGVRVVDLDTPRIAQSFWPLVRYLRRARPTHLVALGTRTNVLACWAARAARFRGKLVVCEHAVPDDDADTSRLQALMPFLMARSYGRADSIVAVSAHVGRRLAELTGRPPEDVEVIYNPVVEPSLVRVADEPAGHPWFEDDVPVILAAGRMVPVKDFGLLVDAFAAVRRRRPARLVILGEGGEHLEIKRRARAHGVLDDVWLPGYVDNPYRYIARASVCVISSRFEALPTVAIEALALGVPVVATDCPGGIREILHDGAYGTLVPVGDAGALAAAIEAALATTGAAALAGAPAEAVPLPPAGETRAVDGARFVRERFSVERAVDAYADHLTSL